MERGRRRTRPALEPLEGRRLLAAKGINLHGQPITDQDLRRLIVHRDSDVPLADRRMSLPIPGGPTVTLTLHGAGSLAETKVRPDGALDLVYDDTNASSRITATVAGGTGRARLSSLRDADVVDIGDLSGIGGNLVGLVSLRNFDLVEGGRINLTGGVGRLVLGSVGRGTQIHLRESPPAEAFNGTTATSSGRTLRYTDSPNGGRELTSVSGQFVPGPNLVATQPQGQEDKAGPPPAPPGLRLEIDRIAGAPRGVPPLGHPQVFGLDPVANALIRFDATTGAELQRITLPGAGTAVAGVGLGRAGGRLVALVSQGTTVLAFDAVSGAPAGQFTLSNLADPGLRTIDGIGSTDTRTVVTDSSVGRTGVVQVLDVTASLASGQAVPVDVPLAPQREFEFEGGLSGVAGSSTVYAVGAAHFDPSQPDLIQGGILAINASGVPLLEMSRTALTDNRGMFVNAGPPGLVRRGLALGSVDTLLALVTGTDQGANTVVLLNPQSLAMVGTIRLADPNRLAGLSESFHPELVDAALIDVQGNIQSFRARSARGLVLNDAGNLNLVQIHQAADSVITGFPFGHIAIARRSNVQVLSPARSVDGRGDVTVDPTLRPIGPLSLP
jgi:hypothetical protein